jgi:hypothetical protein
MPRFVKGQSGNPGGRPKAETTLRELARTHTETALKTLVQIMKNKRYSPQARAYAANSVLDRGYGKPAQSVDLTNSDGSLASAWAAAKAEMEQMDHETPEAPVIN